MSAFTLKLIAIFSMLLDHCLSALPAQSILMDLGMSQGTSHILLQWVRPLGRLAFPIFAFFIAEGCRHTRSPWRYVGRLLLFGLLSELPFRLALLKLPVKISLSFWPPSLRNVFFTLALGALSCFACKALREKGRPALAVLPALPLAVLAELLHTDYGFWGVLAVFAAYVFTEKKSRLLALGGVLTCIYLIWPIWSQRSYIFTQPGTLRWYAVCWTFAMLALTLLALYNGARGKNIKWAFYLFYPAHLTVLAILLFRFFPETIPTF